MDTSTSKPLEADRRVPLRRFDDLPGPRRVPIFGNLPQIESTRVHQQLEQWSAQYGPFFRLQLGKRRVIAVSDHEVIAAVLRDRPEGFRRTTRFEEVWSELGLPNGVFGANGETWRRQRRMVMAGFDSLVVPEIAALPVSAAMAIRAAVLKIDFIPPVWARR